MRFLSFLFFIELKSICFSLATSGNSLPAFPKCCGRNQQLQSNLKSCINVSNIENRDFFPSDIHFWSESTLQLETQNVSDSLIKYNSKPKCNNVEIIPFTDNVVLINNGSLRLMTDYSNFSFGSESYCMDRVFINRTYPKYRSALSDHSYGILLCPCVGQKCIHKCCLGDKILNVGVNNGSLRASCRPKLDSEKSWQPIQVENRKEYFINHGLPVCADGIYLLNKSTTKVLFSISADGSVKFDGGTIPADEYCTEQSLLDGKFVDNVIACLRPPANQHGRNSVVYATFFALGSLFLFTTLFLHIWLPELRKSVHSLNLIMHISCLLIGYVALTLGNFNVLRVPSISCVILGYVIQFSFLAAFFWLNVLCIDISWTFSGFRVLQGNKLQTKGRRQFILYSVYVWGCSAAITSVTAILQFTSLLSESKFKPSFGKRSCWFKNPESTIAFFYGPMGMILFCNSILFLFTAFKINKTRQDTSVLQREGSGRHEGRGQVQDDQNRFLLYLKLFLLMGLTWIFEIVSWSVYKYDTIWYATDFINAFRGLFIFVLFCLKRKIIYLMKMKFSHKTVQPPRTNQYNRSISKSSVATQSTNSLQLSQIN